VAGKSLDLVYKKLGFGYLAEALDEPGAFDVVPVGHVAGYCGEGNDHVLVARVSL
jgi:hypothetical protein